MIQRTWYLIPLVVVVSLVYNASRYEVPRHILQRAGRMVLIIMGFMSMVFVLLYLLSYGL